MVEPVPTGDLSRHQTDSFPRKCEFNIRGFGLSGTEDRMLFICFTYCAGCQAVCLMAGFSQVRGQQTSSNQPG